MKWIFEDQEGRRRTRSRSRNEKQVEAENEIVWRGSFEKFKTYERQAF
jgi:hypothetical protein